MLPHSTTMGFTKPCTLQEHPLWKLCSAVFEDTPVLCVLCWWVRDYLVLIGDNILGAGKNMERGTPGKHQMQYSTKQCADPKKWER